MKRGDPGARAGGMEGLRMGGVASVDGRCGDFPKQLMDLFGGMGKACSPIAENVSLHCWIKLLDGVCGKTIDAIRIARNHGFDLFDDGCLAYEYLTRFGRIRSRAEKHVLIVKRLKVFPVAACGIAKFFEWLLEFAFDDEVAHGHSFGCVH